MITILSTLIQLLTLSCIIFTSSAYEYEATFHLEKPSGSIKSYGMFTFNFGPRYSSADSKNVYADPTMKVYIKKVNNHGAAGILEARADADAAENSHIWTNVTHGSEFNFSTNSNSEMFQFIFNEESWVSLFHFKAHLDGDYAIFGQHGPSEFQPVGWNEDIKFSFVHDEEGNVVEPEYVAGETAADEDKPWGETMGASFAVWAVTFTGLCLLVVPNWTKYFTEKNDINFHIAMFASGIFLSTAFCLMFFEATHLIMAETKDESLAIGEWSSMLLLGFMLTPILHIICSLITEEGEVSPSVKESKTICDLITGEGEVSPRVKESKPVNVVVASERSRLSLLMGILVGDFFHNFCDGIFIGTAFKLCNHSLAWSISAATIAHEIPQEISDFALMISPRIGFSVPVALLANALSGLSVVIGAIIATAVDMGNRDVGMLLAFGGGTYLYCGTVELFDVKTKYDNTTKIIGTLMFIIGAIAIGLVLLDHEHCEGESDGSEAHAGHAH